ncbi:MAG: hypothetical protein JXB34_06085 [Bacteroidales bacterium]|nr:hypothetical protein [Bacteroidales bacterium]
MKKCAKILILLLVVVVFTSFSVFRYDYRNGMHNNVCKKLQDKVLVYYVFVDTKETSPWTEYDIRTTIDSMNVALRWIENQARLKGVNLTMQSNFYIGNNYTTIRKNLPFGTVQETATTPNMKKGLQELNRWADVIASRIGKEFEISPKDGIPEIKNPNNKERLIAHLRDENQVESVALLFMVNNYFRNDISLTVNHLGNNDVEFAIVSYKYPSVIAQNILTLFGAADLYKTFYRRNEKNIRMAAGFFPSDIMQDVYGKNINNFIVDEFTSYMVGWQDKLAPDYYSLLSDKLIGL